MRSGRSRGRNLATEAAPVVALLISLLGLAIAVLVAVCRHSWGYPVRRTSRSIRTLTTTNRGSYEAGNNQAYGNMRNDRNNHCRCINPSLATAVRNPSTRGLVDS